MSEKGKFYLKAWIIIFIMGAVITSLTGCATSGGYKQYLTKYHGQPIETMLEYWGVPQSAYEYKGRQYFTYYKEKFSLVGAAEVGAVGKTRSCRTTFVASDGIIRSVTFQGKLCKA